MQVLQESDDDKPPQVNKYQNRRIAFPAKLSIVALVYTLQGASLEFLQYSVQTELVLNGASNSQLALLGLMEYPWCLKFLWAPLQDAFFFSRIGRRKTWIFGTLMFLAILWGLLSFRISHYIDNLDVLSITVAGVITSIFLTSQDVSMDGWIVKLSESDKEMSNFSWWCSFGYSFGGLLSFTLYIWLSSDEWCQRYFGTDHILNSQQLVAITSICFLVVTFLVAFIPETKDKMETRNHVKQDYQHHNTVGDINWTSKTQQSNSSNDSDMHLAPLTQAEGEDYSSNFQRVIGKLVKLIHNRNLLFLVFFLFFSEVGFCYFDNVGYVEILNRGVSDDTYALFWLISTIFEGITGYFVAKYCIKNQMKIYLLSFAVRSCNAILYTLIITGQDKDIISEETAVIFFGFYQSITEIGYAMSTISTLSFFLTICDSEIEGTYIAILTSVLYAAPIWTATIIYTASDYIDSYILIAFSFLWNIVYIASFGRKLAGLQKLPKEAWAIQQE